MRQISIEVLVPWLESRQASEEQIDAVLTAISDLDIPTVFETGAALIHRDVLLKAVEVIDEHPWKDHNPVGFRKQLQQDIKSVEAKYWLIGADTLPLED